MEKESALVDAKLAVQRLAQQIRALVASRGLEDVYVLSWCLCACLLVSLVSFTRSLANPLTYTQVRGIGRGILRRELGAAYAANASLEKSLAALDGHRAEAAMTHAITTDASLFGLTDD